MTYWLFKSEPDTWGWNHQIAKGEAGEEWHGVRNYQARNYMRDGIQLGDEIFFYHSNCELPGIVGLCTVAKLAYPDPTQFDPESKYYDPGSTRDAPRGICVDVEFVEKLPRLIALDELRANPALDGMVLLQKGSRLSVQPVSPAHYKAVLAMAKKAAPKAKAAR